MSTRSTSVTLGGLGMTVKYTVCGRYAAPTLTDPAEYPELELVRLTTEGGEDISGLLGFDPLYDELLEQIDEEERLTNYGRDPDPDEAYDRWRDAQLEQA